MKKIFLSLSFLLMFISCQEVKTEKKADLETVYDSIVVLNEMKICTEKIDPNFNEEDYMNSISDKYVEITESFNMNQGKIKSVKDVSRAPAATVMKYFLWPTGSTIKVQFLEGNQTVIEKVIEKAKKWEEFANIKFEFGSFPNPDITISFKPNQGSWSYIGVQSKKFRPSMNYGWLNPTTEDKEYERVVLHEFGHALGLIHEHQNPENNPIQWDKKKTYLFYMTSQGWSKEDVDENIFKKYEKSQLIGTTFDDKSIMLYAVPSQLTLNKYSTKNNYTLSDSDKKLIQTIYN